jgi:mRNA interferase MazF
MIKNKIVLVPFPFEDFTRSKVRPALCLSNPIGKYDHVVIAFISSQVPDEVLDTDIVVKKDTAEFAFTGLLVDSVIRIHKLVSIPHSLIKRELGAINVYLQREVLLRIDKVFSS